MLSTDKESIKHLRDGCQVQQQVDLAVLWAQVLEYLQPPSVQVLLRQHGKLELLQGRYGVIALRSYALEKRAQGYRKHIVTAFEQALGHAVDLYITSSEGSIERQNESTAPVEKAVLLVTEDKNEVIAATNSFAAYFDGVVVPEGGEGSSRQRGLSRSCYAIKCC